MEPDDPAATHAYLEIGSHAIWMPLKTARLVAMTRNAEEADYVRTIAEIIKCDPMPACKRADRRLEPPWEVVARMREGWLSFEWVKRYRALMVFIEAPEHVADFLGCAERKEDLRKGTKRGT